ncbi:hypothetical protein HMPREF1599_05925 [Escherichia coli 907713]|nr:hypothetical protein HMPREF1599_05925 [Escherichia coli 907713]
MISRLSYRLVPVLLLCHANTVCCFSCRRCSMEENAICCRWKVEVSSQ